MGHDDLLGEDLFASELDDDFGVDLPEELDPLDEPLLDDDDLGIDDEDLLEEDDEDYSGGYNPDEWN